MPKFNNKQMELLASSIAYLQDQLNALDETYFEPTREDLTTTQH